jgi:hypothetical protein
LKVKTFLAQRRKSEIEKREQEWSQICKSGERFAYVSASEKYLVYTNDPIGKDLFIHGEYDFRKFELALQLLHRKSIQTLVDVGANIGSICIPAVNRIAPTIGATRTRPQVPVKSSRFDTVVGELNPETDLVYIDVQGFEKFVISGAPLATQNKVPMVLEFWPDGLSEHCTMEEFINCLSEYSLYIDLNSPNPEPQGLEMLVHFWDGLMRGPFDFGDILVY